MCEDVIHKGTVKKTANIERKYAFFGINECSSNALEVLERFSNYPEIDLICFLKIYQKMKQQLY